MKDVTVRPPEIGAELSGASAGAELRKGGERRLGVLGTFTTDLLPLGEHLPR